MDLIGLKRAVLAVGAILTTVAFVIAAGSAAALIDPPSMVLLGLALLPIGHLWIFGRDDDPVATRLVLASAAAMIVVFGLWVYVDTTIMRRPGQGTPVFLLVPLLQMAVVLPALLAAWMLRRSGAPARG